MFIGTRPASAGVQVTSLVLGILGGLIAFTFFGGALVRTVSPIGALLITWLGIAATAYYFSAPATWRGLLRRIVSLVAGAADGFVAFFVLVDLLPFGLPEVLGLALMGLAVALSAYYLTAPDSWRGLWRRALRVLGVSLVVYAALGYVFAFVGLSQAVQVPMGGMPDQAPPLQATIVVVAGVALIGSFALRDRRREPVAPELAPSPVPPAQPPVAPPSAPEVR